MKTGKKKFLFNNLINTVDVSSGLPVMLSTCVVASDCRLGETVQISK
ncbi:MAG: hypothetical protein NWF03_06400 [Candidatus Bathyarchaeota archaeon]|nr:hypothetical protein [Candidatus Bathyarchaeota archaeon]